MWATYVELPVVLEGPQPRAHHLHQPIVLHRQSKDIDYTSSLTSNLFTYLSSLSF